MASTEQKYAKLKQRGNPNLSTDARSQQLVFPIDFGNSADHPGIAVVFELNRLVDSKERPYELSLSPAPADRMKTKTNRGVENTEVTMQRDSGSSSMRTGMGKEKVAGSYVKTELTITLPPPDQFMDTLNVGWQSVDMASLGSAGDLANAVKDANGTVGQQMQAATPKILGGMVQAAGGPSVRSFSEMMTGNKQNAYTEVLFGSVTNRFFPFQWTFTPRNRKEAEVVRALIHRFRWASLPQLLDDTGANGAFHKAPWTFDIHFVDMSTGKESQWWPRISTCALTNIVVNRTPQGEFSTLGDDDGSDVPASMVLELQFTELVTLDKSSLEDKNQSY